MNIQNRSYIVAVSNTKSTGEDIDKLKFRTIKNGWNYWVADPFPIEVDGTLYIFGEMYEFASLKGSICYTKLTDNGFTKWKKVIEEPYHLSFPNIFKIENSYYICPESRGGNILQLYRCVMFPDIWVKDEILLNNIKLVDTVFLKRQDAIYGLSCEWNNLLDHSLVIFKMENKEISFSESSFNTIDSLCTRPAGKILYDEYRKKEIIVSQVCKPKYGSGIVFKEFDLNFPNYSEKELYRIYPSDINCEKNKNWDGIHTFNVSDNYTVIDLIWTRFNIIEKFYRILNKFKKTFNQNDRIKK